MHFPALAPHLVVVLDVAVADQLVGSLVLRDVDLLARLLLRLDLCWGGSVAQVELRRPRSPGDWKWHVCPRTSCKKNTNNAQTDAQFS